MRLSKTRLRSYLFLLLNTFCWGAALVIVKPSLDYTTPFRFLLYRYFWASLFSLPILWFYAQKWKKSWTKQLPQIIGLEFLGTVVVLALLYLGLNLTTAIEASLLTITSPLFVTLAGIWYLHEKQEAHEWRGLSVALVGMLILTFLPLIYGQTALNHFSLEGNLLILAQNILLAVYYVLAKKHYAKLPKLLVTAVSFYLGLICFFLLSLPHLSWQTIIADHQHWSVWVASLYMATFGSIVGLTAYIKGQDGIEASEAGVFTYLQPLIYLPLGVFLLKEPIYTLQLAALGIILWGVYLSSKR